MTDVRRAHARSGAPPLQPTVAELRALAHPLRLRILELFAEQPRTTKQVAGLLGEPPTRLYHHVAALERAGLLVLKETRKNRGTVEKWYEAVAKSFGPIASTQGAGRAKGAAARRAVAAAVLERSRQELVLAMQQRGRDKPLVARIVVTGQPHRIAAIRKRLHHAITEIQREFGAAAARTPQPNDARWAVTLTFAPSSTPASKRSRRQER